MTAIENQAPVGVPEILVVNPESKKGDQYTTGTLFAILTRFNNEDLCAMIQKAVLYILFVTMISL